MAAVSESIKYFLLFFFARKGAECLSIHDSRESCKTLSACVSRQKYRTHSKTTSLSVVG